MPVGRQLPRIYSGHALCLKKGYDKGVRLPRRILSIPDANHGSLLFKAIEDQTKWIADRFAGKEDVGNCETILIK